MLVVRNFSPTDIPVITKVVKDSLGETYPSSLYLTIHNLWPEGFQVALSDGRIVAFVAAVVSSPKVARVLMLAVRPECRGQFIGSTLMDELYRQCIGKGLDSIVLEVRMSNTRARAFYEKLGFKVFDEIKKFYTNGEAAFKMMKVLQS